MLMPERLKATPELKILDPQPSTPPLIADPRPRNISIPACYQPLLPPQTGSYALPPSGLSPLPRNSKPHALWLFLGNLSDPVPSRTRFLLSKSGCGPGYTLESPPPELCGCLSITPPPPFHLSLSLPFHPLSPFRTLPTPGRPYRIILPLGPSPPLSTPPPSLVKPPGVQSPRYNIFPTRSVHTLTPYSVRISPF